MATRHVNNSCVESPLSVFDLYSYLLGFTDYDHSSLREIHKIEGYGLFQEFCAWFGSGKILFNSSLRCGEVHGHTMHKR